MLFRFSLYGFLKNQRYFEPFLTLAFLDKGLSFFAIGLLIAFREITVNLLEVPTGAIADVCGRRRSMIFSFLAYIASFLVFGFADDWPLLAAGMFLFGVGESFRTGTHKAMIFTWLRMQGRTAERTRVYGFTRSWSQIGSAVSTLLAALFVLISHDYETIFFFAAVPYGLNVINFLGYPRALEGEQSETPSLSAVWRHTLRTVRDSIRKPDLRRLMTESMGFEGVFESVKGYMQPVLQLVALAWIGRWLGLERWNDAQQASLLVGPVYFVLYLLSATASRNTHRIETAAGGAERAARWYWLLGASVYTLIAASSLGEWATPLVVGFVLLHVAQNLWRPVLISRFDAHSDESQGATVLSIESQAQRLSTMVLAPLLGLAVDSLGDATSLTRYWPTGAVGAIVALSFALRPARIDVTAAAPAPSTSADGR